VKEKTKILVKLRASEPRLGLTFEALVAKTLNSEVKA
jgi:hypothetical protein